MITMSRYDASPLDDVGKGMLKRATDQLTSGPLRVDLTDHSVNRAVKAVIALPAASSFISGLTSAVATEMDSLTVSFGAAHRLALLREIDPGVWEYYVLKRDARSKDYWISGGGRLADSILRWDNLSIDDAFILEVALNRMDEEVDVEAIKGILTKLSVGTFAYYAYLGFKRSQIAGLAESQVDPELAREVVSGRGIV